MSLIDPIKIQIILIYLNNCLHFVPESVAPFKLLPT